jgi:hypothetical protein
MRRLLSQDPKRPEWLRDLSISLQRIAATHEARGSLEDALAFYREASDAAWRAAGAAEIPAWYQDFPEAMEEKVQELEERSAAKS